MDSFELNKLIGAALATVFVVFSVSLISESLFHSETPETPGYAIAALEPEEGAEGEGGEAAAADITQTVFPLLAAADPAGGEALFRRCAACHTAEDGGANKIGPNLYGVVNRPIASHAGFSYSAPMTEFAQGGSVSWNFEHLAHFLAGPKAYVKGTAMNFPGVKKPEEMANLLAYLNTLAASPAPLPEAAPAPAEGEAPAAGGAAPAPAEGPAPAPAEGTAPAPADSASPTPAPETPAPATERAAPATPAPAEGSAPAPAAPADGAAPAAPSDGTTPPPANQ